ncbi:phytanoyl-CoA dioxygenase family protein [Spartinivicinus poritis]|uniref:Phytanoyl-CoA dioxygenase family protein n=1 Tax=Spartinivicinus poritis TaxID=2994640 RepID=A0ABT5U7U2_9GAMM|nr:phytanoyl-CoA dioxygenase family protein [Spartinivicinus sp. A2-2]MDE1462456.1 phytanoyl-CoA dioxygenase family protein [Spartinivicinus sp. A2-2]
MDSLGHRFLSQGFIQLEPSAIKQQMTRIDTELNVLVQPSFQHSGATGLVRVPELDNPNQLCRVEYLAGASTWYRNELVPELARLIETHLGQPVSLFKDKCNFKRPGGGAFPPHQDIVAYRHFGSWYHVTAAVLLDEATEENGALHMATRWDVPDSLAKEAVNWVDTPRGLLPMLPSYQGGCRNGDIQEELTETMQWQRVDASPGDVILFDSYVPHFSQANHSNSTRRILFFTFNLASEGSLYFDYYQKKWQEPNNPIFHVATPTSHSDRTHQPDILSPPQPGDWPL